MTIHLSAAIEQLPLREPFVLARGTVSSIDLLVVELRDAAGHIGRGEAAGLPYVGETGCSMHMQALGLIDALRAGVPHAMLRALLPPGGARNAIDCAWWDLRSKQSRRRVWQLAGQLPPTCVSTAFTLGMGGEADIRRKAAALRHLPLLKIKVGRELHIDMVRWVREAHPSARLIVDANQAWDCAVLNQLAPKLRRLGVQLIEQPVPVGTDAQLQGYVGTVPLAADESCTDVPSLAALVDYYDFINIKLDKAGGLTEALSLAAAARRFGLRLMVGNMGGTSLAMAPALLVAQQCDYIDLDAPLLFARDREHALNYRGDAIAPAESKLWG